jgi:hypothetical protein
VRSAKVIDGQDRTAGNEAAAKWRKPAARSEMYERTKGHKQMDDRARSCAREP